MTGLIARRRAVSSFAFFTLVMVADFTGLGVEDLYIAEYIYERVTARA